MRLPDLRSVFRRFHLQQASAPPVPDPRAELITLRSKFLGVSKRFFVYTPPRYVTRAEPLPTLFLFRGHESEWLNPAQDHTRGGRNVIDVYEELLADGAVGPLIMVFPGIGSDDNSVPGLLVNFRQPDPRVAGIGTGKFEDFFVHELVPYIDRHYRTRRSARAVDGFSLGGFMAVKIALQHPHAFRSVGAFDGLYFWDDPHDPSIVAEHDQTFRHAMFDPAFGAGSQRDRRYAAANNPLNLLRTGDAAQLRQLTWLIEYGPQASEPNDSNFYRGARLDQLLAERGLRNHGRSEIKDSGHTWQFADQHMRYVLPYHWRALSRREADRSMVY